MKWCDLLVGLVLSALIAFSGAAYGGVGQVSGAVISLLALLAALSLIVGCARAGTPPRAEPVLRLPVLIFLGTALISSYLSPHPRAAREEFFRLAAVALVYFVVAGTFTKKPSLRRLTRLVTLWGVLLSLFGVYRLLVGNNGDLSSFHPLTSTFVNRNHLADYLAMILPFPFVMTLVGRSSMKRISWGLAAFIIFVSLGMTLSRGALISSLVSLIFMILLVFSVRPSGKRALRVIGLLILLLLIIIQAGPGLLSRSFSPSHIQELSWQTRLSVWRSTLGMIRVHPLLGNGLGSFSSLYPRFQEPSVWYSVSFAHSDLLQLAAEMGLVGVVVLGWGWVRYVRALFRRIKAERDLRLQRVMIASLTSLIAVSVHSLLDFSLHIPANALLLALILGAGVCALEAGRGGNSPISEEAPRRGGRWVLHLLILLVALGLAFQIRAGLGRIAFERGLRSTGEEAASYYFQKAASLDPSNSAYHDALAQLFVRRFRSSEEKVELFRRAVEEFERAIRLRPGAGRSLLALGLLYAEVGDRESAAGYFSRALEEAPSDPYLHGPVAQAYITIGMIEKGLEHYRRANEIYPIALQKNLATLFATVRDPSLIEEAVPDDADQVAAFGYLCATKGHWEQGQRAFERALSLDPDNEKALMGLAWKHSQLGEDEKAIELWEKVVGLSPENLRARRSLGDAYLKTGQYDRAFNEYEVCRRRRPDDIQCYRRAALALRKKGGASAVDAFWAECIESNPTRVFLRLEAARHYEERELWDEAARHAMVAVKLSPEPYPYLVYLAELYEKRGLLGTAASWWQEVLRRRPGDDLARSRLQKLKGKLQPI